MTRRVRSLAALLALAGFTALLAENVRAVCMPVPAAAAAESMAAHDAHEHAPASDAHGETDAPQHCPPGSAGGNSCIVPVTLASPTFVARVPIVAAEAVQKPVADAVHELIIRTLFHPPRL